MPAVSLILPVFNVAPWLPRFLASLTAQTLEDWELVAVDDASGDESRAILQEAAALDARIRVIALERNGGVARARSTGIDAARGRYLAFVDPDDWMAPQRLARLVGHADAHRLDWVADNQWVHRDGEEEPLGSLMVSEPEGLVARDLRYVIERDPPGSIGYGTLKPLIRRAFLERMAIRFPTFMNRCDDFLFIVTIGAAGGVFHLLNEPLYHYRLRAGSEVTAMSWQATTAAMLAGNEEALRILGPKGDPDVLETLARRRSAIERYARFASSSTALRQGRLAQGLSELLRHPAVWPLFLRRAAGWLDRKLRGIDPMVGSLQGCTLCSVEATKPVRLSPIGGLASTGAEP